MVILRWKIVGMFLQDIPMHLQDADNFLDPSSLTYRYTVPSAQISVFSIKMFVQVEVFPTIDQRRGIPTCIIMRTLTCLVIRC